MRAAIASTTKALTGLEWSRGCPFAELMLEADRLKSFVAKQRFAGVLPNCLAWKRVNVRCLMGQCPSVQFSTFVPLVSSRDVGRPFLFASASFRSTRCIF